MAAGYENARQMRFTKDVVPDPRYPITVTSSGPRLPDAYRLDVNCARICQHMTDMLELTRHALQMWRSTEEYKNDYGFHFILGRIGRHHLGANLVPEEPPLFSLYPEKIPLVPCYFIYTQTFEGYQKIWTTGTRSFPEVIQNLAVVLGGDEPYFWYTDKELQRFLPSVQIALRPSITPEDSKARSDLQRMYDNMLDCYHKLHPPEPEETEAVEEGQHLH